jgi:hypothetical protein
MPSIASGVRGKLASLHPGKVRTGGKAETGCNNYLKNY